MFVKMLGVAALVALPVLGDPDPPVWVRTHPAALTKQPVACGSVDGVLLAEMLRDGQYRPVRIVGRMDDGLELVLELGVDHQSFALISAGEHTACVVARGTTWVALPLPDGAGEKDTLPSGSTQP